MPGNELPVAERMMNAQTTESEKTETQVFSVYISIASVNENLVRFSAQLRSRSASAAYNALPCSSNKLAFNFSRSTVNKLEVLRLFHQQTSATMMMELIAQV